MGTSHSRHLFGQAMILLMLLSSSLPQGAVQADIGWPPINPSGSSLGVPEGESANVRMVEEEVNLTVEPTTQQVPGGFFMHGKVEAVFLMHNLGSTDEALDVWFPLAASVRYMGMLPEYDPDNVVQDFKIWVDNLPKSIQQVKAPDVGDPTKESSWARFPITFPAGKDVTVRVTYTIFPSGRRPFGGFEYILQTGADWKDTIGKATVRIHLPYPVTKENVSLSGNSTDSMPINPQPSGYMIENNVIRWEFSDLEPTAQDNVFVDVLEPERYQDLIDARSRVAHEPDSADAQFALAKASSNALVVIHGVWQNGGGTELAEQVNAAYRRALELAPDREDILVAYITWMMLSGGQGRLMSDGTCAAELCDLLERALELYPNNADLVNFDQFVQSMQADAAYSNQIATEQTATASAAAQLATSDALTAIALTEAAQPTMTPIPVPTDPKAAPQPTALPAASRQSPSRTPQTTPVPRQDLLDLENPIAFLLPLVLIGVIAFVFRSGWIARRK